MPSRIKRIILDVLKLKEPTLPEFALTLSSFGNIVEVKVSLVEIDQNTESVKVTVEGNHIDLEAIQKMMKDQGAVVHSIDEVVVSNSKEI